MNRRTLLRTGAIGSAVTAVCCFTPILILLMTGLGLSAAIGWLDWVLLPALVLFLAMTAYALGLGRRRR